MAGRHNKNGLDYFPLDVHFFEQDTVKIIQAEFGIKGEVILIRLLSKIYENGYYYQWGVDECLLLSGAIGVSNELVEQVVRGLVKRSFFDKRVFDSFGVLTAYNIQEHFFNAVFRRKCVFVWAEYLLLNVSSFKNVNINSINDNINGKNADTNTPCYFTLSNTILSDNIKREREEENVNINSINDNINGKNADINKVESINDGINSINVNINRKYDNIFKPPTIEDVLAEVTIELNKRNCFDEQFAKDISDMFYYYWNDDQKWIQPSNGMLLSSWRSRAKKEAIDKLRKFEQQNTNGSIGSSRQNGSSETTNGMSSGNPLDPARQSGKPLFRPLSTTDLPDFSDVRQ